jgi:hypothetical protein
MGGSLQMVHGNRFGRRNRGAVKHEEDQETGKSLGRSSVHEGEMPRNAKGVSSVGCRAISYAPKTDPRSECVCRGSRARSRADGRALTCVTAGFLSTCELYFRSCPHHMALKFDDRPLTS